MKKSLVAVMTAALALGSVSAFAAGNPFADVPTDHWAYDAVAQLAADGVVEGYGDTTFKGNKSITRYEMAQMVARAMAKQPASGTDKALIDRLAAEFADELSSLGVRVAALERNADFMKWNGEARFTYEDHRGENGAGFGNTNTNELKLRLLPTAEVNKNWAVKARLDANLNTKNDSTANIEAKQIYTKATYPNLTVRLGKFDPIDSSSIADTNFSGADVAIGNVTKFIVGAGRLGHKDASGVRSAADYQYVGIDYRTPKVRADVHLHHLKQEDGYSATKYGTATNKDEATIWKVGGKYTFDKNVNISALYGENTVAEKDEKVGVVELYYKGAQKPNVGTWGAWVAYRHLGQNAIVSSTYAATKPNEKGYEVGGNYTIFKNTILSARYGWGKSLTNDNSVHTAFTRLQFFF